MADDEPTAAAAASHSSPSSSPADEDDEEGTNSDGSNPDHDAAPHHPPPHPPEPTGAIPPPPPPSPPPPPPGAGAEDSRRLFQRLWTDEEELLILRGFLDFTTRRGTTFASHQYDTGPFYDEIRRRLSFDFTKNQLIEKLRRLKKKYRLCAARMAASSQGGGFAFRSAHEAAIYDLARHIWPPALKRDGTASDEDDINPAAAAATATAAVTTPGAMEDGFSGSATAPASTPTPTPRGRGGRRVRRRMAHEQETPALPSTPALISTDGANQEPLVAAMENSIPLIAQLPPVSETAQIPVTANGANEEAVRSILSPLLKEFISSFAVAGQTGPGMGLNMGFGGAGLNADIAGLGFGIAGLNPGVPDVDKWRQQQILELEVYLKRIELVREQVTAALDELRSSEG
uniref:Glabrous enhancer-binding protein-like DBD domain-containing protein n=1 Tax=Oryza punctata TaxID=4537 RepID=A0A0E0JGE1_ORYPU